MRLYHFLSRLGPACLPMALGVLAPLGLLCGLAVSQPAQALDCGTTTGFRCTGTATQYAGGFSPGVGYGGFGGGACSATKTPVIFVHGNADRAISWDAPTGQVPGYTQAPRSVYDEFKARGYNDCELFGVTWLSATEQADSEAARNYHQSSKYQLLKTFIDKVKAYTGKTQVDIVSHSMGVSLSLATIRYYGIQGSVRKFVGIAGGLRGLNSCYYTGYANASAPTCGSQNVYDANIFGFFPEGLYWGTYVNNDWTGTGNNLSLRDQPYYNTGISYYTLRAGQRDQVLCSTTTGWDTCGDSARFNSYTNVKSQLNVGAGSYATQYDWDWNDGYPTNLAGGDKDGVGHFRAKNNTGVILYNMLSGTCTGTGCASGYTYGPYTN
jgi:pimeloyl-ACP methyl ester carboxylesterase